MEKEINLNGRSCSKTTAWVVSILSSVLAVGSLIAGRGDLAGIEGLDAVNLAQISEVGGRCFSGLLIASALCALPMLRSLQSALGSLAYGMLIYVLVDLGAQLREFQSMGIIPDSLMEQVKIQWAGWLMAATTAGFLLVIPAEAVLRIFCRRK
jgi:hypothetical protein